MILLALILVLRKLLPRNCEKVDKCRTMYVRVGKGSRKINKLNLIAFIYLFFHTFLKLQGTEDWRGGKAETWKYIKVNCAKLS